MSALSQEQKRYLDGGFRVIEGRPSAPPPFPYITLERTGDLVDIQCHRGPHNFYAFVTASSTQLSSSELINKIERALAEDCIGEGITAKRGPTSSDPVPVYLLGPSWGDFAVALQERNRQL